MKGKLHALWQALANGVPSGDGKGRGLSGPGYTQAGSTPLLL